jgi:hypothetical protein
MSCEHADYVLEHSLQRGSCRFVLFTIALFSDQNGEWTTNQATLQRLARLGRRRIQQILRRLAESGELAVVSHFGRGKLSTYRLLVGEERSSSLPYVSPSPLGEGPGVRVPPLPVEGGAMGEGAGGEGPSEIGFGKMDGTTSLQPSDRYITSNERLTTNLPN